MENFRILWELPECDTETWSGQMQLEKGTGRLAQLKVATNLQFVKKQSQKKKVKPQYLQNAVKQSAIKWGMPVLSDGKIQPLSLVVLPSLVGGFYLIVQNVCLRSSHHIQIHRALERWKKGIPPPNPKDTSAKDTMACVLSRTSLDGWPKIIVYYEREMSGLTMTFERILWPGKCSEYKKVHHL